MSMCISCDVIAHDMLQNHKLKIIWWQCLKNSDSLITVPEEAEVEWRVEWKWGWVVRKKKKLLSSLSAQSLHST